MNNPAAPSSSDAVRRVTFLGLGVMGYPMAGHLAKAGLEVTVYNRTAQKAEQWIAEYGGRAARTPREAVDGAGLVLACVGNDDDLRSITLGDEGAFAGMARGTPFVDHTTTSANVARELADIAGKQGLHFIDAPVSGGQSGAQNGKLTIMCGGDTAAFERCAATLRHYAAAVTLIGGTGAGQLAKMVNQICIAGMVQGLSEAIHFGENAGLDMARVLEVIGKGAAASWQMENRGKTMIEGKFDYGFAVDWMRKDLGFCLDEAKRVGVSLPVTALVDQFYGDVQALGGNRYDTSSLIWRLRKLTPAG
ncbi:NAD(P)-dependent oxidoreductase [Paraburkholderia sp. RP-4-7]|jgi:3-hydroxyisobutyrate dehydrogenase-like beta-hydroxyacid dehydrogenase|uniref:NAD(P)-dependent oxidoreductase n=1 Tax=Paraburkholderia polaris TaxID=2728848 RepID=A0A848IKS8_9BURK|nr:NAD(P)-dependent oxidoreductase [Paraburkholderia polaris]NMM01456.1 NAD(P)-dependent oxidoreductase [Paraburkholderia polaris]